MLRFATVLHLAPTQGASIGYTTEAGPDARRRLYTAPFRIDTTSTVRARAIRYGHRESDESVATFVLPAP